MSDPDNADLQIGYCTNVHPGRSLREVREHLTTIALEVKRRVRPDSEMGLGLWLSDAASRDLTSSRAISEFREFLHSHGLVAFTFNGFPFSDFHQETVKHRVYVPTWAEPARLDYTLRLAEILCAVQHPAVHSAGPLTVSTLPLGWPGNSTDESFLRQCANNLVRCATRLEELADRTGRAVIVCLEPEPGCLLDTADDVVRFFERFLRPGDTRARRALETHIGVCHDICHSSVMFESQRHALTTYRDHEIQVGKIQVSNALAWVLDSAVSPQMREHQLNELREFAEPRYLHQTNIKRATGPTEFFDDLPNAIQCAGEAAIHDDVDQQWRIHFHVPLFCARIRELMTTQTDIVECLQTIVGESLSITQFELETYAWSVVPEWCQRPLAEGLAQEFQWFDMTLRNICADYTGDSVGLEK